jgi:hypothetical protein
MKNLVLSAVAFAFFVVCPRMAGMIHIISRNTGVSIPAVVVLGTVAALPMVYAMAHIFGKWGLVGALAFCVFTDLLSAAFMAGVGLKAGVETLIIAIFVITGVKVAPLVCNLLGLG